MNHLLLSEKAFIIAIHYFTAIFSIYPSFWKFGSERSWGQGLNSDRVGVWTPIFQTESKLLPQKFSTSTDSHLHNFTRYFHEQWHGLALVPMMSSPAFALLQFFVSSTLALHTLPLTKYSYSPTFHSLHFNLFL